MWYKTKLARPCLGLLRHLANGHPGSRIVHTWGGSANLEGQALCSFAHCCALGAGYA